MYNTINSTSYSTKAIICSKCFINSCVTIGNDTASQASVSIVDPSGRLSNDMRKHILQNIKVTPKKHF